MEFTLTTIINFLVQLLNAGIIKCPRGYDYDEYALLLLESYYAHDEDDKNYFVTFYLKQILRHIGDMD